MLLTLGMAAYDDFHGVAFTCQSLALHNDLRDCEIVVVDSNPTSRHGRDVKDFAAKCSSRVKYVEFGDAHGTTQSRERIFAAAAGEFVLVMDCHVLFKAGTIDHLKRWIVENGENRDIVSGPLVYDNLAAFTTHMNDQWRGGMWGTWGTAWRCGCGQTRFSLIERSGNARPVPLDGQPLAAACPQCGFALTQANLPWAGHEQKLLSLGCQPHGFHDADAPFEIRGMGLGVFGCRRQEWPGFNEHFRGFGGEEMFIHEKFRALGGRALCLPWLKWWHRFGRPDGTRYVNRQWDRVRNYVLGHLELGRALDPIYNHFVSQETFGQSLADHLIDVHGANAEEVGKADAKKLATLHAGFGISQDWWDFLIADPVGRVQPPVEATPLKDVRLSQHPNQPPAGATLDNIFTWCQTVKRDLDEHLPLLKELAGKVSQATEITKRRESTVGLLAGRPRTLITYTQEHDVLYKSLSEAIVADAQSGGKDGRLVGTHTVHWLAGDAEINPIEPTDLLYLHSLHRGDRLASELAAHAGQVRRFLVLKCVSQFGERGQCETPCQGMFEPLKEFLAANPQWRVTDHWDGQCGMTVLSRQAGDFPEYPVFPWDTGEGPGKQLKTLIGTLGINPSPSCDCNAKAAQMNKWGVTLCGERADMIAGWLRGGQDRWGWRDKLKAAANALATGLALKLNPVDPYPGLVAEAIRLAKAAAGAGSQ